MNKLPSFIIVIILVLTAFHVFPQTPEEINQQIKSNRKKVAVTPMKITYTIQWEEFSYPKPETETRVKDGRISTKVQSTSWSKDSPTSVSSEMPDIFTSLITNQKGILIKYMGGCRDERFRMGETEPYAIQSWDGKETRTINEAKRMSDNKTSKFGSIYPERIYSFATMFIPLEAWACGKFDDKYEIKTLGDRSIQLMADLIDKGKAVYSISPKDNYMQKYCNFSVNGSSLDVLEIIQTVKVGELILPSEIEMKKYKQDGKILERYIHYTDIRYEILSEEEARSSCKLEFPQGMKVINVGIRRAPSARRPESINPSIMKPQPENSSSP